MSNKEIRHQGAKEKARRLAQQQRLAATLAKLAPRQPRIRPSAKATP
jgi:CRP-like cAMP-binding protein